MSRKLRRRSGNLKRGKEMSGRRGQTVQELVEREFPTSWIDPLLTGPEAVIGTPPYGCPDIERLLSALKTRLLAAALRRSG